MENPMGAMNVDNRLPKPQIIHPYYFCDNDKKRTCLWLKNLPRLVWTKERDLFNDEVTSLREPEPLYINPSGKRIFFSEAMISKSNNRLEVAKLRSKTFPGIASAMAKQWSEYILSKEPIEH